MCGLCGVLGADEHWTQAEARPQVFGQRRALVTRGRERMQRIRIANRALAHYGLSLADFQGRSYVLRNRVGGAEIIDHVGALWPAAERLAKRVCDPLDDALMARFDRGA